MGNKELINNVAIKMNLSKSDVKDLLSTFIDVCVSELKDDKKIDLDSFGTFLIEKEDERLSVDLETNSKVIIPPKLVLKFNQSNVLKQKLNTKL